MLQVGGQQIFDRMISELVASPTAAGRLPVPSGVLALDHYLCWKVEAMALPEAVHGSVMRASGRGQISPPRFALAGHPAAAGPSGGCPLPA